MNKKINEKVKKALILARVSTKEQKEAGNSLPAQITRLKKYCKDKGLDVNKNDIFDFDESAFKVKRKQFKDVLEVLKKSKEPYALCCDKIDRLIRNFTSDLVDLEELRREGKIELHFYSDNIVLHKNSPANDLFRFTMGVSLAQYYSNSIGDNVKRAFEKKRDSGEITGQAPFGYKSISLNKEKRTRKGIELDLERAPIVKELFERYTEGNVSVRELAEDLQKRKITTIRNTPVHTSVVHNILRRTFYYGKAYSEKYNVSYDHVYESIISKELFLKVQKQLSDKNMNPTHPSSRKEFIFGGLLKCANCGCSLSPEIKKKKYIYYACTNAKGICKKEYIKEADLLKPVKEFLQEIKLSDKKIKEIVDYLKQNHEYKTLHHKRKIVEIDKRYRKIQRRIDKSLDLLIDGTIEKDAYEDKLKENKEEQYNLNLEKDKLTVSDENYHIVANTVLKLAQRTEEIFESSDIAEKNQLLGFLLHNPTVKRKELCFTKLEPFKSIVEMPKHPNWLRRQDSNLRQID